MEGEVVGIVGALRPAVVVVKGGLRSHHQIVAVELPVGVLDRLLPRVRLRKHGPLQVAP